MKVTALLKNLAPFWLSPPQVKNRLDPPLLPFSKKLPAPLKPGGDTMQIHHDIVNFSQVQVKKILFLLAPLKYTIPPSEASLLYEKNRHPPLLEIFENRYPPFGRG